MSSLVAIDVSITSGTVLSNSGLDREVALSEKQVSNKFELYYSCSAIGSNNNNDGNKIEIIFYDEELHMYDASNIFVPILEDGLKNYQIDIPHDVHKIELSFWGDYTIDYFEIYSVFNTSSVEIATETVKGIANFPDTNFVVADGAISLNSSLTLNTPMAGTDKRGISEITAEQGALTIKKWNTNNDSFEGIRLCNGVEQYDPLTDTWKSLGTSIIGGTGMVVAHADATSLTSADLTGGNCLHVGYSTKGNKIVGDNSTIYTDGIALLGYEVVTRELPDVGIDTYIYNSGVINAKYADTNGYLDYGSPWSSTKKDPSNYFKETYIYINAYGSSTVAGYLLVKTKTMVDLTNFSTISSTIMCDNTQSIGNFKLGIKQTDDYSDSFNKYLEKDNYFGAITLEIDVSDITGYYYVGVSAWGSDIKIENILLKR